MTVFYSCLPVAQKSGCPFEFSIQKGNLDAWLDAKTHYLKSSEKTREAIRKFLYGDWRQLSGYDWKLIKQFRTEFKEKALA